MHRFAGNFSTTGKVEWIGVRPEKRSPMQIVTTARLEEGRGMVGDHRAQTPHAKRQLTLIQHENLATIAALAGLESVKPELLRRNIVVSGINLIALIGKRFQIGDTVLEGTGHCEPCGRMEENLGHGAYNAMFGYGGINAIVCHSGDIEVASSVSFVSTLS